MCAAHNLSLKYLHNISDVVGNTYEPGRPKIWSPWSTSNTHGIRCHLFGIAGTSNWATSGRYGSVTVDTALDLETGGQQRIDSRSTNVCVEQDVGCSTGAFFANMDPL